MLGKVKTNLLLFSETVQSLSEASVANIDTVSYLTLLWDSITQYLFNSTSY